MPSTPQISVVRSVEDRLLEAQLKGDRIALNDLLSDEYIGTNPDGTIVNKAQEIENLVHSGYSSGKFFDLSVKTIGNTSIVVGQLIMEAGEASHKFHFTDVYVGEKLVASQATLV